VRFYPFQFLIGSLQTLDVDVIFAGLVKFQFLIGSLQTTADGCCKYLFYSQFQFLIGSLQTNFEKTVNLFCVQVSIPYR